MLIFCLVMCSSLSVFVSSSLYCVAMFVSFVWWFVSRFMFLVVLSSYVLTVVVCFVLLCCACFVVWIDCGRRWSLEQGPDIPLERVISRPFVVDSVCLLVCV